MVDEQEEFWLAQHKIWKEEGTLANLDKAVLEKTPVKILRSNGEVSEGTIIAIYAAAVRVEVRIETPAGTRYRATRTWKFLELNPQFGRSLIELVPADKR